MQQKQNYMDMHTSTDRTRSLSLRTFRAERMIFSAAFRWLSSLRPMSRGACDGPRDLDLDPPVRVTTTLSDRFACGVRRQQQPKTTE